MTTTLCGHERDVLIWALRYTASSPEFAKRVANGRHMDAPRAFAISDIHDPAKLAELIAEELRNQGICVSDGRSGAADVHVFTVTDVAMVHVTRGIYDFASHRQFTMPQARAALLRLMQLHEGTPVAEVLKTLEVAP